MKKYCFIVLLACLANTLFADAKNEIENFVKKDVNSKEFQQDDKLINSLQEHGSKLSKQGKYDEAMQCYQKALAKANKLYGKGSTASAMIYTCMGSLFLKKKEKLKAADSLMKASEIYKKSMGAMLIPHNYYVLRLHAAGIYCSMKKYTVALNILKELEKKIKQIPQRRRAKVYCLLAECYYYQNKFIKATKYCETADKKVINDANSDDLKATNYDLWASCLASLEKRKEAVDKFQKCMKYAVKAKNPNSFIGQVLQNIGVNYMQMDDYSNAKKYFFKSLERFKSISINKLFWQGTTYLYLARNARYHKKWGEAENYYEKTAEFLEKCLTSLNNNKLNENDLKQTEKSAFKGLCFAYKWLQICFYYNKCLNKSIIRYHKFKALLKGYKFNKMIEANLVCIADVYPPLVANYINLKKYKQASILIAEGKAVVDCLTQSSKRKQLRATFCYLDAKILFFTGNKSKAIKECKKALTFLKDESQDSGIATIISNKLKKWEKL